MPKEDLTCCRIIGKMRERLSWKSNRNNCAIKQKEPRKRLREGERVQGTITKGKGDVMDVQPCFCFPFMCQPGGVRKQTMQHAYTIQQREVEKSELSLPLSVHPPHLFLYYPVIDGEIWFQVSGDGDTLYQLIIHI